MASPQKVKWSQLKVGILALVAMVIVGVLSFLLTGTGGIFHRTAILQTYLDDSAGMAVGATVRLNGIAIGSIDQVRLSGERKKGRIVVISMLVKHEFLAEIPTDSKAGISASNLLGDKYIDIIMGRSPRHVRAGSDLRFPPPSNLMQNIDLRQFDAQLRTIDQIIQDIQAGKGPLGQFVVSDALYRQFLDGVADVEKSLRAATGSESQVGRVLYNATMHDNLSASLRQLDDRLAQLQANRLLLDTTQYDQMRDQLSQVRHALAEINAGKGASGQWIASDAAYVEWNRRLAAWIEDVDALNSGEGSMGRMLSSAHAYESLNGALRELQSTMKDFREHPQKFLRIKLF